MEGKKENYSNHFAWANSTELMGSLRAETGEEEALIPMCGTVPGLVQLAGGADPGSMRNPATLVFTTWENHMSLNSQKGHSFTLGAKLELQSSPHRASVGG